MSPLAPTAAAVARLYLAPLQQRINQGKPWIWLLIALLLTVGPGSMFALAHGDPQTLRAASTLAAFEAALAMCCIWAVVAASLIEQNRPAAARLVPRHVWTLRLAALTAAGLTTLASAGVATAGFPQLLHDPLLVLTVSAAMVAGIGAAVRWRAAMWLTGFTPLLLAWLSHEAWWPKVEAAIALAWQPTPLEEASLASIACATVAMLLIQSGGPRHARKYHERSEFLARLRMRGMGKETPGTGKGLKRILTQWRFKPFESLLRATVSQRPTSVLGRLMISLGPRTHWTTQLVNLGLLLMALATATGLLYATVAVREANEIVGFLMNGFGVGSIFGLAAPALQLAARLHQTRNEQTLLVLLPSVPRGAPLARGLSLRLTAQFLASWAVGVLILFAGRAAAGALQPDTGNDLFATLTPVIAASLLLPVAPALWPRWAWMASPTHGTKLWILGLPAVGVLVGFALLSTGTTSVAEVAAGIATVAVAWCAIRWFRMGNEPTPLPVGRLHRSHLPVAEGIT